MHTTSQLSIAGSVLNRHQISSRMADKPFTVLINPTKNEIMHLLVIGQMKYLRYNVLVNHAQAICVNIRTRHSPKMLCT